MCMQNGAQSMMMIPFTIVANTLPRLMVLVAFKLHPLHNVLFDVQRANFIFEAQKTAKDKLENKTEINFVIEINANGEQNYGQ